MVQVSYDCPHCGTKQTAFEVLGIAVIPNENPDHGGRPAFFLKCQQPHCGMAINVVARARQTPNGEHYPDMGDVFDEAPKPLTPEIPEHLPQSAIAAYKEAETVRGVGAYPSAVTSYRKSLEVALREHFGFEEKPSLASMIGDLRKKGEIPPSLADYMDEVRFIGNEGTHEAEPVSKETAEEAHFIAELVMQYVFTLPEKIRLRREAAAEAANAGDAD